MKKLVIIDGKSVFYRGYYAMGNLSTKDGTPTGGVYGFATIAMELVREVQPDKVVVAWDKAKTSIRKRKEIYPEYKAGRHKPPEDFYYQIPLLINLIEALGWGFVECDDYEADDIIGTLSLQADRETEYVEKAQKEQNIDSDELDGKYVWDTIIISSDLDMLQIVDENTRMYRLLKGFSDLEEIDVPSIEEKYGIAKSQFLDLKALKGDASDNIPGVPGIGEKTAVKLLNEYQTLDGIYEHINEISGATQKKLIAGKDSAYMSRKLGKIMFDAPVSLDAQPWLNIDPSKVLKALETLEFSSLIRKFKREFGDDFQSTSASELAEDQPVVVKEAPKDLLILKDAKKSMHESPEIAKQILNGTKFWDLSQAEFLLDPLARPQTDEVKQMSLDLITEDELKQQKARETADYYRQKSELEKTKLKDIYENYDLPLIPILYKMETLGIKISREFFKDLTAEFTAAVQKIEQEIHKSAGMQFNINSPVQLAHVLYDSLGLPTRGIKKTARGFSTGAKELEKLNGLHPIIPLIIKYREAAKLLSTYILPLPELADQHDRIHTTFTQNVTATGRLSSLNPNLQNIPVRSEEGKRIRQGFVAPEGRVFVSADYSQFELRLAAVLAGDQSLIADFNSSIDIHTKTAADVFGVSMDQVTKPQRRAAKTINFGVLYGMSAKGLAEQAGMSMTEAKTFIDNYFEVRKPIREYINNTLKKARELGYVETFYGRRRPTPDIKSPNFIVRQSAERAAANMPIQGTEADLMKRAMIKIDAALPPTASLILQVHDSLIIECNTDEADQVSTILKTIMEEIAPELPIKLAVEVTHGSNWGEL